MQRFGILVAAALIFITPVAYSDPVSHVAHIAKILPAEKDYYPFRAADAELSGGAAVQCKVLDTGRLTDCAVLVENPKGYGFGAAVAAMATDLIVVDLAQDKPGDLIVYTGNFGINGR